MVSSEVKVDVGPHRVVKEGEDQAAIYFGRTPDEAEMRALIEGEIAIMGNRPLFLILDLSSVDNLSAPVRRAVAEGAARIDYRGIAIVGASFQMKAVARLVNGALGLFRKQPIPQQFHDSRDEALVWFDSLRKKQAGGA